ncbi:MAG: tRNA (adenosine(37)-N6)-threonylcarbamoyltransferase complex transferase subunit TsaD [Candidatus Bipolaricaulia bacterium]
MNTSGYTLGIETSCDETAVAVLHGDRDLRANVIYSQAKLHQDYGGVVPEIASRNHLKKIDYVIDQALSEAGITIAEIDLVGVTYGPGLVGPLLVGLSAAKAIAYGLGVPFIGVNHLEGHLFAHYLDAEAEESRPPFLALIASGGHTLLVYVEAYGTYRVLGETRDDAAGEAFDKVGQMLGLGYPAGPEIDRLAKRGDPQAVDLPRPMLDDPGFDFSFAGLKTAVVYYLKQHPDPPVADLAASFQRAAVDVLVKKTLRAAKQHQIDRIAVVGGVAANSELRQRSVAEAEPLGNQVFFPSLSLCTDNAAMIAAGAAFRYRRLGEQHNLGLAPEPSLGL